MAHWKTSLLDAGFTGDLVIPSDPDYDTSLARFASNAQKPAGLVAFVKSASDVSLVIKFATSQSPPIQFVVRGGGHSTSGASSSDGGIVIDLSRYLNTARVDVENKRCYAGGGCNWAAVDAEAIKYGLATVGGTVNHTGIGGLTLGGGYGFLTGAHGMVVDNLLGATIVTADGSILTVNDTTNSDLFWGIRGGGCNFGCVTEFVYKLHPQRTTVYAGALIYPAPRFGEVIEAIEGWYTGASSDEGAMLVTATRGRSGGPEVAVFIFYNGEEDEGKNRFKKLLDLGPVANLATMIPYEKLNAMQNDGIPYGINYHLNGVTRTVVPADVGLAVFNKLIETANAPSSTIATSTPSLNAAHPNSATNDIVAPEAKLDSEPVMVLLWEYYNLNKQSSIPADATAYRMRVKRPLVTLLITWKGDSVGASKDAKARLTAMKMFCEGAFGSVKAKVEEDDTGYGNNEIGNPQSSDAAAALYGRNYPRLQEIKKKYDPNMVFKAWYPIRPAA